MKNTTQNVSEIATIGPNKDFESIKKLDENGAEYWTARELAPILGYETWRRFEDVIKKAKQSCINSRQFPQDHFADIGKMTQIGHGIARRLDDYKLSRFACYLVAQNGDSSKQEIALAQTYFAIQTRKQEIADGLPAAEKRIRMRDEIKDNNKKLFSAAKQAGVSNFGLFNDAGYKGLYEMPLAQIETKKNVPKGQLLDHMGSEELGANIFRITQTEAKLKRENIHGDLGSRKTHFDVGKKVRQTMRELGSEMPENLKTERHIRELKRDAKAVGKNKRGLLHKNFKN
ncbi:MAG: DNA damage-inducible protein D [Candidatus Pacebacteria bacterium]|nr:DNA damage-inducible protein D [Candidatus Paceibacterota bacterium]